MNYSSKSSAIRGFRRANPTNTQTTAELSALVLRTSDGRYYIGPFTVIAEPAPVEPVANANTKNYIGISRDHSASMRCIAHVAGQDYNSKIESIREAALANNQDTIVSVVECGAGSGYGIERVVTNSNVTALKPIQKYIANGHGTPLFDSVGDLIEQFEAMPDSKDPSVSFLVMAITDGDENCSKKWNARTIAAKIQELNKTDRWTFVFRVPRGAANALARLGIPQGNILEWDQTEKGTLQAATQDKEAFTQYFTSRALGATSTMKFYTDLSSVTSKDVEVTLDDVSAKVLIWPVGPKDHGAEIRTFVEARLNGKHLLKGAGFYQLTKKEDEVQDYKKILIRDKTTQAVYYGQAARQMLGLPTWGMVKVVPGNHGNFDIFIQSTSVNRKLAVGTSLIYWEDVGTAYKEGISAAK